MTFVDTRRRLLPMGKEQFNGSTCGVLENTGWCVSKLIRVKHYKNKAVNGISPVYCLCACACCAELTAHVQFAIHGISKRWRLVYNEQSMSCVSHAWFASKRTWTYIYWTGGCIRMKCLTTVGDWTPMKMVIYHRGFIGNPERQVQELTSGSELFHVLEKTHGEG